MSEYLDSLITDRTLQDVESRDLARGCVDCQTLNRVELAIKYVSIILDSKGYRCNIKSKTNWQPGDKRLESEMVRIRGNLEAIRTAYYTGNDTPVTPSHLTYTSIYQANAIEQIIYDVGGLIESAFPGPQRVKFKLGARAIGDRG